MKSVSVYLRRGAAVLLLLLAALPVSGQVKDRQHSDRLESARKLYYSGSYYAAEKAFTELGKESLRTLDRSEIEAYKVMCAIALDKVNAEGLVNTFCNRFPNAPQQSMVKEALASRYFDTGKYQDALDVYNTIERDHLYKTQRTGFTFKKAYSNLKTGGYDLAEKGFAEVLASPRSQYTVPSTYYKGYVHYIRRQFAEAVPLFERVGDGNQFSLMADYFAVESKLMLKDYDYVIKHGTPLFDKLDKEMQSSLARILSEACYEKGDRESARRYLDIYAQSGAQMSRKDHYFSGIISYSLKSWPAAIESFSHVLGQEDELGQNAWYYTANSFLETRNKIAALDAFKAASECDFDKVIQEDALFNYAKLSFDVNTDISQFRRYLEAYPESGKGDIIHNYMAASFLLSKDYSSAVDALRAIKHHTPESSANLQKASFFRALQLIEGGGYRAAEPLLETAVETGENDNLRNLARFWEAECCYRDERYSEAISILGSLLADNDFRSTSEYPQALYNQAYNYLKSGNFVYAENNFRNFINVSGEYQKYERDAQTRLADACFMQGKYADAARVYERVYEAEPASEDLYPVLQASVAYGLMGEESRKIDLLKEVTRNNRTAPLYPQALFELGRTYVQAGRDDDATECFYTLLGMKGGDYYTKALLELALINANSRKYDKAIEYYKAVVTASPSSSDADDALAGLESIYQLRNRPEDFLAYLDEIGRSDIKSADEKEQMIFNSAEQVYMSGRHSAAISSLQRYLAQYPTGAKAPQATFYLAECLRATGRMESAADHYLKVTKMGASPFRDEAQAAYAAINLDLQHYREAADAYKQLISRTRDDAMRRDASIGLMRASFGAKDYEEVIRNGQMIGTREARFLMAKSFRTTGDRESARSLFEELAADCSDAYGAESTYILIREAYDRGDFDKVEELVYAFSRAGSDQLYWLAKSFIILGDSFADRGDTVQAEATFNSILDGYQPTGDEDDVPGQVRSRLSLLKKTNR
ncbi:MAG: tetratricopeptide repeat protein [Bacteroidales bacterium]|nr:tetratricopeptide repeat protein [Bacteroidales bacterium]